MSTTVDNTITTAPRTTSTIEDDSFLAQRDAESVNDVPSEQSIDSTPGSQDSGMVLTFSTEFKNSLNKPLAGNNGPTGIVGASGLNLGFRNRTSGLPSLGTPLCDLRRPSIVDMVNSGGIFINQCGTCEINLDNVNATDLEQLYAGASIGQQRRGSCPVPGNGYKEELLESSCMQKISLDRSLEQLDSQSTKHGCLNTSKYWWRPNFNSEVLEKQLKKTVIEFLRRRFRVALVFIGMFTLLWIVIFSVNIPFSPNLTNVTTVESRNVELAAYSVRYLPSYVFGGLVLFGCVGNLLVVTFTRLYAKFARVLSVLFSLILMCCSFALAFVLRYSGEVHGFFTMSFVAQFAITAVVILVIFTLSRLPMWLCMVLSILYLSILECLVGIITNNDSTALFPKKVYIKLTVGRLLFYAGLILSGVTTAYLLKVRQLGTFWKIAQCVLSQKALDLERELEEKTILSMMPKHFADGLLNVHVQIAFMLKQRVVQESEENLDPVYQSISAPFNICSMDNVTILFADIVQFTKFSSTLSAAELVGILNDVFCMFDEFVTKHKCEKISTLGDCYFCVSGCPELEPRHADNCVNMGLAIIDALEDYRKRTKWPIEMRVGIHTGSVLCGVMGTKRFKFDVWSKDVRIANHIESASSSGRVLISGSTYSCLSGSYIIERVCNQLTEPELANINLYFVTGQKARAHASGMSGLEWKKKINTIDTVCKPEKSTTAEQQHKSESSKKSSTHLVCPWWKKKQQTAKNRKSLSDGHLSSSIVDIQAQLQRCTSYADLAIPQGEEEEQNVDMDEDIVKYMEEHKVHFDTYFDPQLHLISLNFHNRDWELTYRNYGRDLDDGSNGELTETELGYRISKLSYMLDTLALFVSFLLISIGSAVSLSSDETFDRIWYAWLGIFVIGMSVEIPVLVFVFAVFAPHFFPDQFAKFATRIINWYARSLVALFFIYYPMAIVAVSITQCQIFDNIDAETGLAHVQMTFFITIVVLISSITFMEISHIVKFVGGLLSALLVVVMILVVSLVCTKDIEASTSESSVVTTTARYVPTYSGVLRTVEPDSPLSSYFSTYYSRHVAPEAVILLLLILILLAVVNRMSEVSVRLSFIGRIEAAARRRFTQQRKVQAEWLLFNIIPPHVAYELRKTGKYSQNYECVGVMFASIVNFQYFLQNDENKGEDSLRLLNTIISEFDMLLERQQFVGIEKIKTIGSTYMAASGLNTPPEECDPVSHLLKLIEFGDQLVNTLELMNHKITGFVFDMHIGFNYGPVTSGVVGSRKMLYDIWGDTVNVASRMDTTGVTNKIHMPQSCLEKLGPHVTHTFHKVVNVKGKGEMKTVFVTSRPKQIST